MLVAENIYMDPQYKILIKEKRLEKGFSKKKLSEISGVARSIISDLENGKYDNPTCITLVKLSKVLGCSIDQLIKF